MKKRKELFHEIYQPEDVMRRVGIRVVIPQRKISKFEKFRGFVNTTNSRLGQIGERIEHMDKKSKKKNNPFAYI